MAPPTEMNANGGDPPLILVKFTCVVITGIMANFTLLIPTATLYSDSLVMSAALISSYAGGAIISLLAWSQLGKDSVRGSYLAQAGIMAVGNLAFGLIAISVPRSSSFVPLLVARFFIGLEAGAMYNASLAIVSLCATEKRGECFALYQAFVSMGLVVGPVISVMVYATGRSLGVASDGAERGLAPLVMSFWGFCVFVGVLKYMPSYPELLLLAGSSTSTRLGEALSPKEEEKETTPSARLLFLMGAGNFMRIFQRLGWEVGAVTVLLDQYGWSIVEVGVFLGISGLVQMGAQYVLSGTRHARESSSLLVLSVVELAAILLIYSNSDATNAEKAFYTVLFVLASIVFYVSNCLSSAPFQVRVLENGGEITGSLLSQQLGVFLAYLAAPLVVRGLMSSGGSTSTTLAGTLSVGWALQTAVTHELLGEVPSFLTAGIGALAAIAVLWTMLDRSVGGTGPKSTFSWHPILMSAAFLLWMTVGQLAYREDTVAKQGDRQTMRARHVVFMISAAVFALGGYLAIFSAHHKSGESQIGLGPSLSRSVHAWLGYCVLLWLTVQTVVGFIKGRKLIAEGEKVFAWHGASGKYLLIAGYVVATIGFWLRFNYSEQGGWPLGLRLGLTGATLALLHNHLTPEPKNGGASIPMQRSSSDEEDDDPPEAAAGVA